MANGKRTKNKRPSHLKKGGGPGVMNIILVIVGIILVTFTIAMVRIFMVYGAVPDTLITCVFAVCGGECGVMGWIKTTKDRNQARKWELDDRKQAMKQAQDPPGDLTT